MQRNRWRCFPETNPLLDELGKMDVNSLSPIEALNKLFEWQSSYFGEKRKVNFP